MRILLVEDDTKLSFSLSFQLQKAGYVVDCCEDGEDALYYILQNAHDLVLLDCMLPNMDGLTILKKMRQADIAIPVIMLTALGELEQKISGLDAGADDYLVKPFAFEELLARIRSINRRPHNLDMNDTLKFGDLSYSPSDHILKGTLGSCTLSKKESALLEFLIQNSSQTLPRATLLTKVWGVDAEVEEGNLDNYMHFIRRRLNKISSHVTVKTVRGVGYHLEDTNV